jgi:hypothetical protein
MMEGLLLNFALGAQDRIPPVAPLSNLLFAASRLCGLSTLVS